MRKVVKRDNRQSEIGSEKKGKFNVHTNTHIHTHKHKHTHVHTQHVSKNKNFIHYVVVTTLISCHVNRY